MRTTSVIICILLIVSLSNCSINKWDVNRHISKFEKNQKHFETLVNILRSQNKNASYPIYPDQLSEEPLDILKELDLSDVNINTTHCPDLPDYEFTTTWSSKATVYITKTACRKDRTRKGYHGKVGEMIEVWGLGNGWLMWIDHDFI